MVYHQMQYFGSKVSGVRRSRVLLVQILAEEITPTLKRLKEERSSYLEYQKIMREVEHLSRLSVAFHFVQAEVGGA